MSEVQIIVPAGMFGPSDYDSALDKILRAIAVSYSTDKGEWAEKYGTNFENEVFLMHRFCWCDAEDGSCLWCIHGDHPDFERLLSERFGSEGGGEYDYQRHRARHYYDPPNFWHKPTDFRVRWYKYIGRDVETNKPVTEEILTALSSLIQDPVLEADAIE